MRSSSPREEQRFSKASSNKTESTKSGSDTTSMSTTHCSTKVSTSATGFETASQLYASPWKTSWATQGTSATVSNTTSQGKGNAKISRYPSSEKSGTRSAVGRNSSVNTSGLAISRKVTAAACLGPRRRAGSSPEVGRRQRSTIVTMQVCSFVPLCVQMGALTLDSQGPHGPSMRQPQSQAECNTRR